MTVQPDGAQTVFHRARDIESAAERQDYLDKACAENPRMRQEVESLLRQHEQSDQLLGGAGPDGPTLAVTPPHARAADDRTERVSTDESLLGKGGDPWILGPTGKPGSLGRLGHYEIREMLGRGAFGVVFKAFDEKLHRVVAVKVLGPQLAEDAAARQRFLREARSAAAVRNQHVVGIHAVEEQPIPFLVMEYIAGQTLQQKLDAGPLDLADLLRIGAQVAEGLSAAHGQGLIHRDIKPANILLEDGVERVKITDFGLARAAADTSITQSGVVAGTPTYMAPEQARGETIDYRADLFSLGSVLYALCTGRPPFAASTPLGVLHQVSEKKPPPVRDINPNIPEWLCAVIDRLQAKKPEGRYTSAAQVADLLVGHLLWA